MPQLEAPISTQQQPDGPERSNSRSSALGGTAGEHSGAIESERRRQSFIVPLGFNLSHEGPLLEEVASEYLHHLQQLRKWPKRAPNVTVGDLVLLKNELQPPTKWALARIVAVHPGGLARVVSVRTANGTFKRSITKIVPLPIEPRTDPEREAGN